MQRNWILPVLIIGTVAGLTAVAGYPYLGGAQNPRNEVRQVEIQPASLPKLPLPPMPLELPAARVEAAPPAAPKTPAAPAPIVLVGGNDNGNTPAPASSTAPAPAPAPAPASPPAPTAPTQTVKSISVYKATANDITKDESGRYYFNETSVKVSATFSASVAGTKVIVHRGDRSKPEEVAVTPSSGDTVVVFDLTDLRGDNKFRVAVKKDDLEGPISFPVYIQIRTTLPRAISVSPQNLSFNPGTTTVTVQFDPANPIVESSLSTKFTLAASTTATTAPTITAPAVNNFNKALNSAEITIGTLTSGSYKLTVAARLKDIYGNESVDPQVFEIVRPVGADLPLVAPGISNRTGPNVSFPEFLAPREKPQGFNPGDHVETRVVRLYYFRDAHRVAQILNRDVQSYNRVAVDTRRRLAEQARTDATNQQLKRKVYERDAVQTAQETRAKEHELKAAEDFLKDANQRKLKGEDDIETAKQTVKDVERQKPTDDQRIQANATLKTATSNLADAKKALRDLQEATPAEEIKAANDKVTDAKKNLDAAKKEDDRVKAAFSDDAKQIATDNLASANMSLTAAQATLAALDKKKNTPAEFAKATADVKQADSVQKAAQKTLDQFKTADAEKKKATDGVASAQAAFDDSVTKQAPYLVKAKQIDTAERTVAFRQEDFREAQAAVNELSARDTNKQRADDNVVIVQGRIDTAKADIEKARQRVISARNDLQLAQTAEVQKRENWQASLELEDKMRADQFRLEVAAMHEDPDTYVPGKLNSPDPVQQVSISVLGESEIHLRGPISGINIIREMINQIDSPTGQVRVAIHTIQINGERQEKMECVAANIQDYIDHSRFLTQQSALLLRKAVFKIASRKAHIAYQLRDPRDTQVARDKRYLHEFFGKDFIDELEAQKSEFLNTSNKLLSLNSMDTTSLASALFIIALAKNDTRQEILDDFKHMLAIELPMMEQSFFEAAGPRNRNCGKLTAHNFGCFPKKQCVELMAHNARFQSLLGFFDAGVEGPDTLTPMQREFIKLAQILKSRLVTEMEFKQRVMERALVEDRGGGAHQDEVRKAYHWEVKAKEAVAKANEMQSKQLSNMLQTTRKLRAIFELAREDGKFIVKDYREVNVKNPLELDTKYMQRIEMLSRPNVKDKIVLLDKEPVNVKLRFRLDKKHEFKEVKATYSEKDGVPTLTFDAKDLEFANLWADEMYGRFEYVQNHLDQFSFETLPEEKVRYRRAKEAFLAFADVEIKDSKRIVKLKNPVNLQNLMSIPVLQTNAITDVEKQLIDYYEEKIQELTQALRGDRPRIQTAYEVWVMIKQAEQYINKDRKKLVKEVRDAKKEMDDGFIALFQIETDRRIAWENFERSRRPLDHKKMLDMLIDEVQEKYVELLEGTRSYTANIDDYIKRLATALDDDFNTQFYYPAFRKVRTMATSWDVQLGAVETTSILTNNRTFGKVDPQATMEFDLPKRSIFITEAFQSAKGLLDTYGALMQDPTFLNLARIGTGMPTATPSLGSNAGVPSIRSVLPGMSRATDESVMAQSGPGAKSFGTPLDALIPDPAIYKFETGTAYEIRPIITPDGQSVNFHFNYMYTTNIREPVRADEKHLGRVKRHFIDTNVQLGNYELREISTYRVALRAARTSKGVPLLQDIPGLGFLFRPLPSAESSLQQNVIMGQSTIFPTLFDLMGLRWAPSIADLDPLALVNAEFIVRQRKQFLTNRVFDFSSSKVDEALRIPDGERRGDLYRTQQTIPFKHPNGYQGPGMGLRDSDLKEKYDPRDYYPPTPFAPNTSPEGHLNPNSGTEQKRLENEKRRQDEMFRFELEKLRRENEKLNKDLNDKRFNALPMPQLLPAPAPMPAKDLGPQLTPALPTIGPQSLNTPNPASVFTTIRLSSADLNAPESGGDRLAVYHVAPAPRRTLWTLMFGNR